MEKIGKRDGGRGQTEGNSNKSVSSNQKLFVAIREELDGIESGLTITSPDAPVAAGVYSQVDTQATVDLLNEIKGKLNAIVALAKKFEK